MRVLPITESWLFSRTAQQVYFVCACTVFGSLVYAFALMTAGAIFGETMLQSLPMIEAMTETAILAAAVAIAILTVGMWYHALRPGGLEQNPVWLFALLFLSMFGTMLYYLVPYRRSVARALSPDISKAATGGR